MKHRIAYWSCQAIGWGTYSALGLSMAARQMGWQFHVVVGYVLFSLYSIALTDAMRREIKRRDALSEITFARVAGLMAAAVALAAIQTFLVCAVDLAFQGSRSFIFLSRTFPLAIWASVSGADCIWVLFYTAISAPRRFREREIRLQLALREAELKALEAQIHPHFLFNCLNSIRALVIENPAMAQDLLTRFANILRYNLNRDLEHTVPLVREMEIVTDYLALEAARLEDRLRVRLAIDAGTENVRIPPMLLQMLVENALKHGIAPRPEGGELLIGARLNKELLEIEVVNTGALAESNGHSTHVGLQNTRERLRILYGGRASLELRNRGSEVAATVMIPRTV